MDAALAANPYVDFLCLNCFRDIIISYIILSQMRS
jgi:hypothetical protein